MDEFARSGMALSRFTQQYQAHHEQKERGPGVLSLVGEKLKSI